jgi:hypothetical protein
MQAPEVVVVLVQTKYVTLRRRVEIFNELMKGMGGQSDDEYNHVRRGYNSEIGKTSSGCREMKMVPAWGGCGIGNRLESTVYLGLHRMMQEAGFETGVNETDQWIRMTPQELWREKDEEESECGCVVTRAGRTCKYCESLSRGETETRDSEVSEDIVKEETGSDVTGRALNKREYPFMPDAARAKKWTAGVYPHAGMRS